MSTPVASPPSRFLRTLPWLAGLLIGATAHIVWFTAQRDANHCDDAPSPRPEVAVHVHTPPQHPVVWHVATGTAAPKAMRPGQSRYDAAGARGAVVCELGRCTLRRSFLRRLIDDPEQMSHGTRLVPTYEGGSMVGLKIFGVFPGGLADLLGLVNGDTLTAIDGQPVDSMQTLVEHARALPQNRRLTLTLEHGDMVRTMRYRVIEG